MYIPPSGTTQYVKHTWVAHIDNHCVGYTHFLLEPEKTIKFIDAWVHEDYRRQGIFRTLWDVRWEFVKQHYKGYTVYAWCKPMSLPLLLEKGFIAGEVCTYVSSNIK
jgi:GNAT superfamily N-acetyltransferase